MSNRLLTLTVVPKAGANGAEVFRNIAGRFLTDLEPKFESVNISSYDTDELEVEEEAERLRERILYKVREILIGRFNEGDIMDLIRLLEENGITFMEE